MAQPGQVIGNYRLIRLIGTGGFAEVYEAEDPLLERKVALKLLLPQLSRSPELIARFEREVQSVAALDHPGIVPIYSVGNADGEHYYAMRMLPGGDLRDRIERGLTPPQALSILIQLADAFAHAHRNGIVHRDVKPENILFDDQRHPVLTDFGVAKMLRDQSRLTATGMAIGTPAYLSPEQARGGQVDARADLYSLGVILFEMLTGRPPYDGPDPLSVALMHVTEPPPKLPAALQALQPLLDPLMAKDPAARFETAAALGDAARAMLRAMGDAVATQAAADTRPAEAGPMETPPDRPASTSAPAPSEPPKAAATPAETPVKQALEPTSAGRAAPKRPALWVLAGLAMLAVLAAGFWRPQTPELPSDATPRQAIDDTATPATTVDRGAAAPASAYPVKAAQPQAPEESRAERIARGQQSCALHVSALTADGNLVYDDARRFPGAREESDGSGIYVPKVQLANGQRVNVLVTPEGCVLIRSLAAAN